MKLPRYTCHRAITISHIHCFNSLIHNLCSVIGPIGAAGRYGCDRLCVWGGGGYICSRVQGQHQDHAKTNRASRPGRHTKPTFLFSFAHWADNVTVFVTCWLKISEALLWRYWTGCVSGPGLCCLWNAGICIYSQHSAASSPPLPPPPNLRP
jgi:hypothetical protein